MAFKGSGLFTDVTIGNAKADHLIEITVVGKRQYDRGWRAISWAFLGILPYKEVDSLSLVMNIKNKDGKSLAVLKKADRVETWNSLLFVPLFPILMFVGGDGNWYSLVYDTNRQAILEAHKKMIF